MAAFVSSFLDNPFEAQVADNTHVDVYGNIINANGIQIGVKPGSVADIGSKGTMATPTSTSSGTQTPTDSSTIFGKIGGMAESFATGGILGWMPGQSSSSRLENGVFIVIGLILIAAAVFSFKPAQDVAVEFAKGVAKGAATP
jgi:hypothetical protein